MANNRANNRANNGARGTLDAQYFLFETNTEQQMGSTKCQTSEDHCAVTVKHSSQKWTNDLKLPAPCLILVYRDDLCIDRNVSYDLASGVVCGI